MPDRRASRPTLPLIFSGTVVAWDATVSLAEASQRADGPAANGPRVVMLKLSLLQPMKGRTSAVVNVVEQWGECRQPSTTRPRATYARLTAISKTDVHILATVSSPAMSGLLALATSNRLRSFLLACDEPYRGRAEVIALRFGTQEPDDLG